MKQNPNIYFLVHPRFGWTVDYNPDYKVVWLHTIGEVEVRCTCLSYVP